MIEEIQLEPIPEYLSNQRVDRKKKPVVEGDSSMLLLDEDQVFEKDLPRKDNKGKRQDQLLSEIAEEDDVSCISESVRNPYGVGPLNASSNKNRSSFGPGGKSSITSVKSVQSTSKLSATHQKQPFTTQADTMEKKRRSEMLQPGSNVIVSNDMAPSDNLSINS